MHRAVLSHSLRQGDQVNEHTGMSHSGTKIGPDSHKMIKMLELFKIGFLLILLTIDNLFYKKIISLNNV